MSFLTHLECGLCGTRHDADRLWNLCPECGKPLLARYDLEAARRALSREEIARREPTLWRYRELLPVRGDVKSLRVRRRDRVDTISRERCRGDERLCGPSRHRSARLYAPGRTASLRG
jgi:threonine synthase